MKRFALFLAGLAFLLLVSIGLAASCVVGVGHSLRFGGTYREKASRAEERSFDLAAGRRLSVDLPAGDVRVESSAGAAGSVKAKITAWGETAEEAKAWLAGARIEVESTGDEVRIRLVEDPPKGADAGTRRASADLEIRVPDGVKLALSSGSGDVSARGAFADSKLHSSYGDVSVRGVDGDLDASSSSGDVEVTDVRGGSVVAKSSYGDVSAHGCHSTTIEAKSSSGDVRIEDAQAEKLSVGSQYGNVEAKRVTGDLDIALASGDAALDLWKGERARIQSSYGDVRVSQASGSVEAKSSSGEVEIGRIEGTVIARSDYGDVKVDGVLGSLVAETSSGDVVVLAREGSRVDGPWKLSSSYGAASLQLPGTFRCDLDARTAYGSVDVDVPVDRSTSERSAGRQSFAAKVRGGGGRVEIRCTSGDVRVSSGGS